MCADASVYKVSALGAGDATLTTAPAAGCLAAGDEVLLINLQGRYPVPAMIANTGTYETLTVQTAAGSAVTFTTPKAHFYGDTLGMDDNINLQRVFL